MGRYQPHRGGVWSQVGVDGGTPRPPVEAGGTHVATDSAMLRVCAHQYKSEELAHMLLPVSWLVRVNNSALHVEWLDTLASAYLAHQQPSGCVQEFLGTPGCV